MYYHSDYIHLALQLKILKIYFKFYFKINLIYFREPIDYNKYPDYGRIVSTPMDLTSIQEDLRGDNYNSPLEFCEDVQRVFQNSLTYSEVHPDEKVFIYLLYFIILK